jgi:hypothetical protein
MNYDNIGSIEDVQGIQVPRITDDMIEDDRSETTITKKDSQDNIGDKTNTSHIYSDQMPDDFIFSQGEYVELIQPEDLNILSRSFPGLPSYNDISDYVRFVNIADTPVLIYLYSQNDRPTLLGVDKNSDFDVPLKFSKGVILASVLRGVEMLEKSNVSKEKIFNWKKFVSSAFGIPSERLDKISKKNDTLNDKDLLKELFNIIPDFEEADSSLDPQEEDVTSLDDFNISDDIFGTEQL